MRVKEYNVLVDCVERGVTHGMNRAYKHSDTPTPGYINEQVIDAVLLEICEYFDFDNEKVIVEKLIVFLNSYMKIYINREVNELLSENSQSLVSLRHE
jgi:hypothetical protein